ncbi:hypothetical protein LCGC14_1505490 [marine sediment metagenome]|uniref:Serine aminopeptidase S33 domain-containing protein n=1 Tax=marine sediment metagenome TaxID=412755 RepID=A0A0F9LI64_9ZZZZ
MDLKVKNINIPGKSDNVSLRGSIYYTLNTKHEAPFVVILPGFLEHRTSGFVKYYAKKFANAGYYTLSYDYRAHGETKTRYGSKWNKILPLIFSDIHVVLEWILEFQSSKLLTDKIVLFSRSLGGGIALSHGFIDERAKILIALSPRYDYHTTNVKFQEEVVKKISPHYFLRRNSMNNERILIAHCRDDDRIPFQNLNQFKDHLGLIDENVIIFESGGHSFKGHREEIFKYSLEFLKKL